MTRICYNEPDATTEPTLRNRTYNKPIRVSPREKRTYEDVVYHSIAEMKRAQELDLLLWAGDISDWFRQVPFQLGPDCSWKCDFLVLGLDGLTRVEDVKEFETPASRRIKRLWKKYGVYPLWILGLKGGKQIVQGGRITPWEEL